MKLYLAHTEDDLPEYADNVRVILLAGHPEIKHNQMGNCPDVTDTLKNWLDQNSNDDVYVSYYEPVTSGTTVSHFEVYFWFADATQAMLFKLAWGGR